MSFPFPASFLYGRAGESVLCLLLGGLFTTLFSAYTLTGQVGVQRLKEKFPALRGRLVYWEPRWDVLRYACMLCAATMQVGLVTFAVLALGVEGEDPSWRLAGLGLGLVAVFILVFHLLPRALSRSYADRISVAFLPLAAPLGRLLYPLAWPVARLARALHRLFQEGADEEDRPTPEDEIRSVVNRASTEDLEEEERHIIQSVFDLGETVTREIMQPRVNVEGLEDTETVLSAVDRVKSSTHSRFPLYHETMDDVRGVVHVKDLLRLLHGGKGDQPVAQAAKEVPFVPETMPINDLLTLLRSEKSQTAIVVDEYGGTAGLVTMEDIIEELVGDIMDEYDLDETNVHRPSDGSALIDARMPVDEVNDLLDINIPEEEDYDSLGGYVFHELGRIPRPGEVLDRPSFQITVQTASRRQLHTLRVLKKEQA